MDINYICEYKNFGTKWALTYDERIIPIEILKIKEITEYFSENEDTIYLVTYKNGEHTRELDSLHFNGWEFFDTKQEAEQYKKLWT